MVVTIYDHSRKGFRAFGEGRYALILASVLPVARRYGGCIFLTPGFAGCGAMVRHQAQQQAEQDQQRTVDHVHAAKAQCAG